MATWFNLMTEMERRHQEVTRAAQRRHQYRDLSRVESRPRRRGRDILSSRVDLLRSRYELFLASLGKRFVVWGRRLQKRYR